MFSHVNSTTSIQRGASATQQKLCSPPLLIAKCQEQHKLQLLNLGQTGREEQRQGEPRMVEQAEKVQQILLEVGCECVTRTRSLSVTSCCTAQGSWRAASDRSRAMCYGVVI